MIKKCVIETRNYEKHRELLKIITELKISALISMESCGRETITYFCETIPDKLYNYTQVVSVEG